MSANRYIMFVELSCGFIRDSRIPLYSSKFSKKIYTRDQLLTIRLLKEYLSEDNLDAVELTGLIDLTAMLDLKDLCTRGIFSKQDKKGRATEYVLRKKILTFARHGSCVTPNNPDITSKTYPSESKIRSFKQFHRTNKSRRNSYALRNPETPAHIQIHSRRAERKTASTLP
jgi:hypothetical protein